MISDNELVDIANQYSKSFKFLLIHDVTYLNNTGRAF